MTIQSIDVTMDLPESRERAVLLEMLKVVPLLKAGGVDAVICGGWVPFLKELARNCQFMDKPAIRKTVASLRKMFSHGDSKWVEMILDHMKIVGIDDRDQEARMVVRTMGQVFAGLID